MAKLKLFQKVSTVHGTGRIIGFETFDEKGNCTCILASEDNGNRAVVQLADPENWIGSRLGCLPHYNRYELTT